MRLASIQKKLTFDERYLNPDFIPSFDTPFKEIRVLRQHLEIQDIIDKQECNYEQILTSLITAYKDSLRQIRPDKKYLLCASGGSDTRILCALLAQLRDEEGYDFDNITFHCWGRPEEKEFRQIMKKLRFANISILDDSGPDAFDVGTDEISVQGWYPYDGQMKFWGNNINPKDYILTGGAGEFSWKIEYNSCWNHRGYFSNRGESICHLAKYFSDIFFPLVETQMLSISMAIPSSYKNIRDPRINRDKLRTDICAKLDMLDIPMPRPNPRYNFNLSASRKRLMKALYEKSLFKKEFKASPDFDRVFANYSSHDAKMWAFAVTVYEKLLR